MELSIVLVILGLLTGGILAGQSLIRAAEVRSVMTEFDRYVTATQTFRDKYFALPGDMRDATRFWGRQVNAAHCVTNSSAAVSATTGVCDGNGNGLIIATAPAASQASEGAQLWRQLAMAGLIEGTYAGLVGAGAVNDYDIGVNAPRSKLNQSGWTAANWNSGTGNAAIYGMDFGNHLIVGGEQVGATNAPTLRPEEAWNIDTKLDDGKPGFGTVIALYWDNACATGGADATDRANSVYKLTDTSLQCALYFRQLF